MGRRNAEEENASNVRRIDYPLSIRHLSLMLRNKGWYKVFWRVIVIQCEFM
jgi:hypothetical protein